MTIGKGTPWGRPGLLPSGSPCFGTDAELAHFLDQRLTCTFSTLADGSAPACSLQGGVPLVGLTGGALWRTIGGPGVIGRYATKEARQYPCDLGVAEVDGHREVFVASLVARNRFWTRATVVMNAQDMRAYRFGHRAHPGDALLDMYEANITISDVFKVAKRAKLGSHLPHPGIVEKRLPHASFVFARPRMLWLDEHRLGRVSKLSVVVVPDAFTVVV